MTRTGPAGAKVRLLAAHYLAVRDPSNSYHRHIQIEPLEFFTECVALGRVS